MDLYRTLRISLYVLVATGAFSIWSVEGNFWYLLLVGGASVAAYFSVDVGRQRPLRSSLAGAFCVALLLKFMLPAMDLIALDQPQDAAAQMAHYLVVVQVVLFFTAFRGSVVFTFCGSTLFVVVVSGILNDSPSFLIRLVVYLGAMTWALFIHSLWRERSKFLDRDASAARRMKSVSGRFRPASNRTTISERAIWQGLQLSGTMALICLFMGFILFFSWPRLSTDFFSELTSIFPPIVSEGDGGTPELPGGPPGTSPDSPKFTGPPGGRVILNEFGTIHKDPTPALTVKFSRKLSEIADTGGRIFFRGNAYNTYVDGSWIAPRARNLYPNDGGNPWCEFNKNTANYLSPRISSGEVTQKVKMRSGASSVFFTLSPVRRIARKKMLTDEEGSLFLPGRAILMRDQGDLSGYEVVSDLPVDLLNVMSPCGNRKPKYLAWKAGIPNVRHRNQLRSRVSNIVYGAISDREKALRIQQHLQTSERYRYSLELDKITPTNDPIGHFLFGPDGQRIGHCAYFATAFVLMSRAAGLPARLVDGFARSVGGRGYVKDEITFRNEEAHAWAEIYFEGEGWVAVDATPGDPGSMPDGNLDIAGAPPPMLPPESEKTSTTVGGEASFVDNWWSVFTVYGAEEQEAMYGGMGDRMSGVFNSIQDALSGLGGGGVIFAVFLWLFLAAVVALVGLSFYRRKESQTTRVVGVSIRARAAICFYNDLLSVLSHRGFVRQRGQTPREFAEAVVRRGGDLFVPVLDVTKIFERIRYGGDDIQQNELDFVKSAFKALELKLGNTNEGPSKK